MEIEELDLLWEKDEPLEIQVFQNGKYYIASLHIYPKKLHDALFSLYNSGEMKTIYDESEKQMFLEKLRNKPPYEKEIERIRAALIEKDKSNAELTDEQVSKIGLNYFKKADESVLLKRLAARDVYWTFAAMMRNFETEISNSFLRILSTSQMRAANEIRKELELPLLTKKEMKEFIEKPHQETENIILDTARGGSRPRKGFVWKEESKAAFYTQVIDLPKINNKPMWEYAWSELMEKDFSFYIEEHLRNKTPFKKVPKQLFGEAIRTWKKYKDELIEIKPHEKPRAFEFRHALDLLKYPEITYSTAKKYFQEGKILSNPYK